VTEVAAGDPAPAAAASSPSSVHLLVVHGVGRHNRLANLLRTYQSLRANLTSVEAPVGAEDQIPGWRLSRFEEGASPPFLTLVPRVTPETGDIGAVHLYEVNYSGFAGVVRENHPIDLTSLFLGLDLAVCAARQRPSTSAVSVLGGNTARLGACLQRVSAVLTAATVPIVGLPSILFRNYIGTFVRTFARFFEDVATFALDKNGEQLIATHLDRTVDSIAASMVPGDRLVVAAHSLGSVVVHNFVVRQWTTAPEKVPDVLITFGSPIGLLAWAWLFLDFHNMDFREIPDGDHYFCWHPVSNKRTGRKRLAWINVVNCVDPIATAFPVAALDLSVSAADIAPGLTGGGIVHRFLGPANVHSVGRAHTEYFNDKEGFLNIVLREAGMVEDLPVRSPFERTADAHRQETESVLRRLQWGLLTISVTAIFVYCGIIARRFGDIRVLGAAAVFVWPALTVGVLAFFQRLLLGGPTKRITTELIRELSLFDLAAFPYRVLESVRAFLGHSRDINPMTPSPGYMVRLFFKTISLVPTLAAMSLPLAAGWWLTRTWPTMAGLWTRLWSFETLIAIAVFMGYVTACGAHELVRTWRQVLRIMQEPADAAGPR
jgi:hypothetical protein